MPAGLKEMPGFLLIALMRALSHRIRTPLSVVVNELSYRESLSPTDDGQKALQRCREIAALLKSATIPGASHFDFAPVALFPLLKETFEPLPVTLGTRDTGAAIRADRAKLAFALRESVSLLGELLADRESRGAEANLITDENGILVIIDAPGPVQGEIIPRIQQEEFGWFSELFYSALGLDRIEAPLIDAIFLAHRIQLSISVKDGYSMLLRMPVCDSF